MKYRIGFVTNSSSSSYICCKCSRSESGFDLSMVDAQMCSCVNKHIFCIEHIKEKKNMYIQAIQNYWNEMERLKETNPEWYERRCTQKTLSIPTKEELGNMKEYDIKKYCDNFCIEYSYGVPSSFCPICSFETITDKDFVDLYKKDHKKTESQIIQELIERFGVYEEMKKYLKNN